MVTPLYFGPSERPLAGWYHAPDPERRSDHAVVICQPLGHEYINAHRTMRHLANRLSAAGIAALRFDYDGTGDSAGCDEDPGRLAAWIGSVRHAERALRDQSGCRQISLAGLRMGATLAALLSNELEVSSLLLWAPCVRGRTYVRELKALAAAGQTVDAPGTPAAVQAGGFVITEETQRALGAIDLEKIVPRARRILIATRDDFAESGGLRERWISEGLSVEHCQFAGYVDMLAAPHNTRVPDAALATVVQWFGAGASSDRRTPPVSVQTSGKDKSTGWVAPDVRESVLRFGDGGGIIGVLSQPAQSAVDAPVVLLANAGATHHVGPGRLYVDITRALAAKGVRCLRIDLPGLGESAGPSGDRHRDPYPPEASRTIHAAIETLRHEHSASSFVLMGLCSGAHTAFHAALDLGDDPILEAVLINPLTFYYKSGMPLDVAPSTTSRGYADSIRALSRRSSGVGAVIDLTKRIVHAFRRARRTRFPCRGDGDINGDLGRLAALGRHVTFIFSRFDPGYDLLMADARRTVKRGIDRGEIALSTISMANHTFETAGSRAALIASVERHFGERYRLAGESHAAVGGVQTQAEDRIRLLTFVTDFGCGGTERQFINLGVALDHERFALEYGCSRLWGKLLPELSDRGMPMSEYPIRRLYGVDALRQQLRLARHLKRRRIQILHSFNFYSNVFAVPAAWLAGVPVIIASIRDRGVYLTPMQRHVQRYVCRLADRVLVNAESIKDWLVGDGYDPSNIVVIPNGIDCRRFDAPEASTIRQELSIAADAPIIAMLARLNAQKGFDDFIDAAALVSREYPDARFLIVGEGHVNANGGPAEDGTYSQALAERALRLGLQGKLMLTGYRADVPALLSDVAVSVLPSHSEGLSNTLLESMAAGVPIVATRVGGTPEAIEDGVTGLLIPVKDPAALARSIIRVLSDSDLAARLGAAARRSVNDRFSMERMIQTTEQLYLDLLVHRAAPGSRGYVYPQTLAAPQSLPSSSKEHVSRG
jgi:glycosyltransferase involved in cell wall biosynthesis/alpha-beta hydrolase superfamily lysophospholipase